MRLCHFADTHLGAGAGHPRRGDSGLTLRQEDIVRSFVETVDRIIGLEPDVCIHAGDLFDSVRPLNKIIAIAGEQLHRLSERAGIPTIIIAGNHDAPKQPHVGAAIDIFKQIDNLYVASGSLLEVFEIKGAKFFALPHCLTTEIQKRELGSCVPDHAVSHNVLIMHGVASGMPEFSMADLGEQELPIEVMERFDYTALGHFHNRCEVAPRAWYAGSTERLSQAERDADKGFIEVNLDPFAVGFHEVACRAMADLERIDATGKRGDELLSIIQEKLETLGSGDKIIRVNVEGITDETMKTIPADLMAQLKEKSFSLDIRFEREKGDSEASQFGRSAIGRLDQSFIEYLKSVDLKGFDADRLIREALKYLNPGE